MIVLGIDTATERLSAALIRGDAVYERRLDSRSSHCERLTVFIGELIGEAGIIGDDIDLVAVSIGPGSFTGLRIGIATAMGFAYALGIETVGVDTLMGLSFRAAEPGSLVCPLIDARRSEAYTAFYRMTDTVPETVVEPHAVPVAELGASLAVRDEPVTVTGPAAEKFRKRIEAAAGTELRFLPPERARVSSVSVARLGALLSGLGKTVHPAALKPRYLRRSDAELSRKKPSRGKE